MSSLRSILAVFGLAVALLPAMAQQAASQPAEAPRFAIYEFEISGNSVLPVEAVEAAVTPFLGEGRQIADVEAARAALEKVYQQAGYLTVFVDIPEQRIEEGVVRLNVTEGRVERLKVSGSRYYSQGVIRERMAELAEGGVPNFNEVQRQIATLSRDERQVQPILRPGRTPGTVEAELKVTDKLPLGASVELNNRHAPDTEPWRLSASVRYDNLFQRDQGLALTVITAPQQPSQSKLLSATYTMPLADAQTLVLYGVASDSLVEPLGAATVVGKGVTLGARWMRSIAYGDSSHSLGVGLDYKDLKERVSTAGQEALSTPLRYLPLQGLYNGAWFGDRWQATLNTSLVFGLRGLMPRTVDCPGNIGPVDQFACKRQGSDGSFAYWRGDFHLTRPLSGLPGSFALRLGWQGATQPLVSAEQYAIGGAETVRGYLEAEASGDHALLGSLEWRSGNLVKAKAPIETSALAFLDVARAYVMQPSAGQAARVPLLGSGLGLRVKAWTAFSAELDVAWPHKPTRATPDNDPRVHVRLMAQF